MVYLPLIFQIKLIFYILYIGFANESLNTEKIVIIFITTGATCLVTQGSVGRYSRLSFLILIIAALICMTALYVKIKHKLRYIKSVQKNYQAFLKIKNKTGDASSEDPYHRSWSVTHLAFILVGFVTLSLPWMVNELVEGFGDIHVEKSSHAVKKILIVENSIDSRPGLQNKLPCS